MRESLSGETSCLLDIQQHLFLKWFYMWVEYWPAIHSLFTESLCKLIAWTVDRVKCCVEKNSNQCLWYWIEFYRSYRKRTGKMRPFIEAIRPLIPFVSLFIITTIWVLFSKNSIANKEPRLYLLLLGTIFSNISVMFLKWNLILDVIRIFLKNDFFYLLAVSSDCGSDVGYEIRCVEPLDMDGLDCHQFFSYTLQQDWPSNIKFGCWASSTVFSDQRYNFDTRSLWLFSGKSGLLFLFLCRNLS